MAKIRFEVEKNLSERNQVKFRNSKIFAYFYRDFNKTFFL